MAFITVRRHWDTLVKDATHTLKHPMELKEWGTSKTEHFAAGTPVHLHGSRKEDSGIWTCMVYTPKYYRGKPCKSGYRIWLVTADDIERIK